MQLRLCVAILLVAAPSSSEPCPPVSSTSDGLEVNYSVQLCVADNNNYSAPNILWTDPYRDAPLFASGIMDYSGLSRRLYLASVGLNLFRARNEQRLIKASIIIAVFNKDNCPSLFVDSTAETA